MPEAQSQAPSAGLESLYMVPGMVRYWGNRCTHSEAVQRAMLRIYNGGVLPACGDAPAGQVLFPPRNEPFDFRLQLEAKYRDGLRRAAVQTHVDVEAGIVWTQEYLRYRVKGCDAYEAVQRVFAQIDGRGVQPVCVVVPPLPPQPPPARGWGAECGSGGGFGYCVAPVSMTVPASGGIFSFRVTTSPADARWTASSDRSWVRVLDTSMRIGSSTVSYSVSPNSLGLPWTACVAVERARRRRAPAVHEVNER